MALTQDRLMQPRPTLFWVELVCDKCATTTAGRWIARRVPVREMKSDAKKEGWIFEGSKSFCSKTCREAFEACT